MIDIIVVRDNEVIYRGENKREAMDLLPNFVDTAKEKYRVYEFYQRRGFTHITSTQNASQSPIDNEINGKASYLIFPSLDLEQVINGLKFNSKL